MNILEALKRSNIRIQAPHRWLVVDGFNHDQFEVYERLPYQKKTREIYIGTSEEEAVKFLLGNDNQPTARIRGVYEMWE